MRPACQQLAAVYSVTMDDANVGCIPRNPRNGELAQRRAAQGCNVPADVMAKSRNTSVADEFVLSSSL